MWSTFKYYLGAVTVGNSKNFLTQCKVQPATRAVHYSYIKQSNKTLLPDKGGRVTFSVEGQTLRDGIKTTDFNRC